MIVGIGSDLIGITRIDCTVSRFGDRSLRRVITETERRRSDRLMPEAIAVRPHVCCEIRLPALDFAGARFDLAGALGYPPHFRLFEEPAA